MATGVSLGALQELTATPIADSEKELRTVLSDIKSGKDVDAAHLLYYTQMVNQNSLTVSMISSIVKERADTLKGCCQKF
ncbi:hypothetical protein [Variovorax guangxiensis]|uniref:hypothetical protein n=1 Tax=Variovorax guangxiensis TaxID=1775474 RepID=UPI0028545FD4|nr:hypothetical protein [Variovorax guangxiensis]MDR6856362.1 transcriptional regulator of acetoin/glycerol metabolism [Variovorax guangxiensis]